MVIIVTSKAYIVAERINFVTMQSISDDYGYNRGKAAVASDMYDIVVEYVPVASTSGGHAETVAIRIKGEKSANKLLKTMVSQIREQCPDQLFLDKIAEQFLIGGFDIQDEAPPAKKNFRKMNDDGEYQSKGKMHKYNSKAIQKKNRNAGNRR